LEKLQGKIGGETDGQIEGIDVHFLEIFVLNWFRQTSSRGPLISDLKWFSNIDSNSPRYSNFKLCAWFHSPHSANTPYNREYAELH
jgi:hypothetical protein